MRPNRNVNSGFRSSLALIGLILLCIDGCKSGPASTPRSDWADVVLHATGVGTLKPSGGSPVESRITAIQEAKLSAYQKLEEEILRLRIDDRDTVSGLVDRKPKLSESVREFVRGARIASTRVVSEERLEVDAELFLGENFKVALGLVEPKPIREKVGPGTQRPKEDFFQ